MATQKNTTQAHNPLELWNTIVDQQMTQLNASYTQMAELQKLGKDQSGATMETTAKFVKESMDFAGKVSAEWTQMSLDANKRTMEMFRSKD